jgi:glycosyltransferase involved in cell wall biosynthesis
LWRRERQKALRLERRAIRGYDVAIACSSEDAATLANMRATSQSADITTVPNGVDVEAISPTPIPLTPRLLFPGTLSYRPNVDGAVWFCDEVLPRIRQRIPEVSLSIAGRTPVQEVLALARLPGVSIQANVPSMTTHFEATRAVVVPIRIGTGTRLKALEALAAGRPVVGTTIGLEGLGLIDGVQARIADEPEEMASAIVEVLLADDVALQLAQAGRKHVEGQFSWDRIGVLFAGVLARALKARVAAGPDAASGVVIDR